MDTTPKPRWYQFTLRTLLIFITLAAGPGSWVIYQRSVTQMQKAAVTLLGKQAAYRSPFSPRWLQTLFVDVAPGKVVGAVFAIER